MDETDVLRDVNVEGYRLTLWTTQRSDSMGKSILGYRFHDKLGAVLFEGEDFHCSPCDAVDSDETLRSLLGFLTLKPGDTDSDYFTDYTAEQMAFAQGDAEYLSLWAMEPDESDEHEPFEFVDWSEDA